VVCAKTSCLVLVLANEINLNKLYPVWKTLFLLGGFCLGLRRLRPDPFLQHTVLEYFTYGTSGSLVKARDSWASLAEADYLELR